MLNTLINAALSLFGLGAGQLLINGVLVNYHFFEPISLESEVTEESIDASDGQIVTTHIQKKLIEYEIRGTFTNIIYSTNVSYSKIKEMWDTKQIITLAGSEFDERLFAIADFTKDEIGLTHNDFTLTLKELNFVQPKEFEYDSTLQGRAKNGKSTSRGTTKTGKGAGGNGGGYVETAYGG